MRTGWVHVVGAAMMAAMIGCRTMPPELRPPKEPEKLIAPPSEQRFDTPTYPKEAFNNRDPLRKLAPSQEVMATKGTAGMPGGMAGGPGGGGPAGLR